MTTKQKNNPLHGITLEELINQMVDFYGWEKLGKHLDMKCFNVNPSVTSCLKFLRRNKWARDKVENFYLHYGNPPWREGDK